MANIDCHKAVVKYHSEEVVLYKSEQDEMRSRRDNGRIRLENGLNKAAHPLPYEINSQGSYAMRTMVQDNESDYDIDDGVYFESEDLTDKNGIALSPKAARTRIKQALHDDRLAYDAVVKNNCVRQLYPAGYHIDLPVYRIMRSNDMLGNPITKYELASGNDWVESDARAVTKWFNGKVSQELNSGEVDYSQLRRIVRLTKKMARSRKAWKSKTTSGITITKLVVDHFVANADRDDLALIATWKAIKFKLCISLAVSHPVLNKNLAEWDDEGVKFFNGCLADSLKYLEVLDADDCTEEMAMNAWNKVFDTDFFSAYITVQKNSSSLLRPSTLAAGGLTFPDKPVIPNKSSGFA